MGKKHEVNTTKANPWLGTYSLQTENNQEIKVVVEDKPQGVLATWIQGADTLSQNSTVKTDDSRITISLSPKSDSIAVSQQYLSLQKLNSSVTGWMLLAQNGDSRNITINGKFDPKIIEPDTTVEAIEEWINPITEMTYPFGAYGRTALPAH